MDVELGMNFLRESKVSGGCGRSWHVVSKYGIAYPGYIPELHVKLERYPPIATRVNLSGNHNKSPKKMATDSASGPTNHNISRPSAHPRWVFVALGTTRRKKNEIQRGTRTWFIPDLSTYRKLPVPQ
jgi:hypothetical protein